MCTMPGRQGTKIPKYLLAQKWGRDLLRIFEMLLYTLFYKFSRVIFMVMIWYNLYFYALNSLHKKWILKFFEYNG